MAHTWVPVGSVIVDERRKRDLGDIGPLMKSIQTHGLMNPIVVTRQNRLVSGWRRLAAVQKLGKKNIEAYIVDNAIDAAALIDEEGKNPEHFKEMVWSERMALALILEDLDYERSRYIIKNARVKAAEVRWGGAYGANWEDKGPSTKELVSRVLGCNIGLYGAAREVYLAAYDLNAPESYRELALTALDYMDRSDQPNGAKAILRGKGRHLLDEVAGVSLSATDQRNIIEGSRPVLDGVLHGFNQIVEIHDEMSQEEATRWLSDLRRTRRGIEQLINKLRRFVDSE